ncbi:unnamed protein product [Victoria cruziana]
MLRKPQGQQRIDIAY